MADLMSAGPNRPCPYPGEPSVTGCKMIILILMVPFNNISLQKSFNVSTLRPITFGN